MAEDCPVVERGPSRWAGISGRLAELHGRYARYFWTVHSIWALLTGAAVLVLAHNRYGYIPWVIGFLALTWASTLFFSRVALTSLSRTFRFAQGFVSYLTRVMYQETLFFLLPFYFYSTTFPSWNSAFVVLLAALAVLSCFDLLFDRLLRERRAFALGFFAVVSFSALQFFLPVVLHVRVHHGTYLAAVLALAAAVPLALPWQEIKQRQTLLRLALLLVATVAAVRLLLPAVPPVPLRLARVRFAAVFDPRTLRAAEEFTGVVPGSALAGGKLYMIATVFAPTQLPTALSLQLYHNGKALRSSRTVELVAHPRGFRVWDVARASSEGFAVGRYSLEVRTGEGQLVGRQSFAIIRDNRLQDER